MADQIVVNYDVLIQVQRKLDQLAGEILETGRNIGAKTQALRQDGWQGRGSDAFYAEMNDKIAPGITGLREALEEASGVMGRIVQAFREADESARTGFEVKG
jgi:WXG100 family type VII secretion target